MYKREQTNHNGKYVVFFEFDDDRTDGQTAETDEQERPGQ
jgi:hypothetical protein